MADDRRMVRSCARSLMTACLLLAACNDDGGSADITETGESGDGDGDALPDAAPGWESSFVGEGGLFECDAPEADLNAAGVASVAIGDATLYVGAEENNQNEQDAVFARYDAGVLSYCVHHETDGPNGIGLGLTWDGGPIAYVVYATYAAGSGFENLGGWLPEYAPGPISGVGVPAAIVGRVDVATGTLDRATFIIAVDANEDVAEYEPAVAPTVLTDGSVDLVGTSVENPIDADAATAMVCAGPSPHVSRYVFSGDLAQLVCISSSTCTPQMPCP
jgi:hypothetical protein